MNFFIACMKGGRVTADQLREDYDRTVRVLETVAGCLENWVAIAEAHDQRDYDLDALIAAGDAVRHYEQKYGRLKNA